LSDLRSSGLRHALKQAAITGTTGSLLLGTAVAGLAVAPAAPTAAATAAVSTTGLSTAPVTLHTQQVASHSKKKSKHKHVDVNRMMRTAASLKGRPYRYGATGPWAFDCSGYTLYVLKKQGITMPRTAAQQYGKTVHVSKRSARKGDLVFFYGGGGIYHVGIYAGHGKMWAAPHTGAVVHLQKIYGSNWVVGRLV
jgi:cell wall-associated NlpC family hydrolase